jgi:hypothetical protein
VTTHRLAGPMARLVLIAVLVGFSAAVAAAAWPRHHRPVVAAETASLRLVRPADRPSGPVAVTGVEGRTIWSDAGSLVTALVENRGKRPVTAAVWWLLADPEQERPWVSPAGRGKPERVRLDAGETARVAIHVAQAPSPGVWTLSLWAHTVQGGRTVPSHGVNATPLVTVLPTNPDVLRLGEPGVHAILNLVEPVGRLVSGDDREVSGPDALVSAQAATQQPVQLELRCYLAPPGSAEPWRNDAAVGSYVSEVNVTPGAATVGSCRFPQIPRKGEWQLSAFLRRAGSADSGLEDGLYSRRRLSLGDGQKDAGAGSGAEPAKSVLQGAWRGAGPEPRRPRQ